MHQDLACVILVCTLVLVGNVVSLALKEWYSCALQRAVSTRHYSHSLTGHSPEFTALSNVCVQREVMCYIQIAMGYHHPQVPCSGYVILPMKSVTQSGKKYSFLPAPPRFAGLTGWLAMCRQLPHKPPKIP